MRSVLILQLDFFRHIKQPKQNAKKQKQMQYEDNKTRVLFTAVQRSKVDCKHPICSNFSQNK